MMILLHILERALVYNTLLLAFYSQGASVYFGWEQQTEGVSSLWMNFQLVLSLSTYFRIYRSVSYSEVMAFFRFLRMIVIYRIGITLCNYLSEQSIISRNSNKLRLLSPICWTSGQTELLRRELLTITARKYDELSKNCFSWHTSMFEMRSYFRLIDESRSRYAGVCCYLEGDQKEKHRRQ
jgi:hypothetical protein